MRLSLGCLFEKHMLIKDASGSLAASLIIEAGTLIGSKTSSPLNLSDWKPLRIAIYFITLFLVFVYFSFAKREGKVLSLRGAYPSLNSGVVLQRVFCPIAIGAVAAVLILFLQSVFLNTDLRAPVSIGLFVTSVALVMINWKFMGNNLEVLYTFIAVPIGLVLAFAMPFIPEISWDGQIHFAKANCLSFIIDSEFSEADILMADASAVEKLGLLASGNIASSWSPNLSADAVSDAYSKLESLDDVNVLVYKGTLDPYGDSYLSVACIGYIPSAIGLWLGRLLHLGITGRLLLARLCQFFIYVTLFYFSIKSIKQGKTVVMTLGLLLTPLMLSVNFTYDAWGFALTVFSFSYFIGRLQVQSNGLTSFDWITVLLSFLLATLVKAVNFPMAFIFLLAPGRSFQSKKMAHNKLRDVSLIVIVLLASFLVPLLFATATGSEKPDLRGGASVSPSGQIKYVLNNPLTYVLTFCKFTISFFSQSLSLTTESYFTYLFESPICLGIIALIIIFGSCLFDTVDIHCCKSKQTWSLPTLFCVIASYALAVSALYASFTPVGANSINGFQQRYLLPYFVPLLLIVFRPGPSLGEKSFLKVHWTAIWTMLEYFYAALYLYFAFFLQF